MVKVDIVDAPYPCDDFSEIEKARNLDKRKERDS